MSPIFIIAMTKAAGRALQGSINSRDGHSIIQADRDLVHSIISSERWISNPAYLEYPEEDNDLIQQRIQHRGRILGKERAMTELRNLIRVFCDRPGLITDFGFMWNLGNAVRDGEMFPDLAEALVSIFPECRILLVTDSPDDCADRILEDWSRFVNALAIDSIDIACDYAALEPNSRRFIANNWAMAQKAVIDSLHGSPNCITIPSVLINKDPNAALLLAGVIE